MLTPSWQNLLCRASQRSQCRESLGEKIRRANRLVLHGAPPIKSSPLKIILYIYMCIYVYYVPKISNFFLNVKGILRTTAWSFDAPNPVSIHHVFLLEQLTDFDMVCWILYLPILCIYIAYRVCVVYIYIYMHTIQIKYIYI
jgi:hypothetical protein